MPVPCRSCNQPSITTDELCGDCNRESFLGPIRQCETSKIYEYKIIRNTFSNIAGYDEEKSINNIAKKGWRLISVVQEAPERVVMYFEKVIGG
jgi:Domain of unknown function (DUF4177)